LSTSPRRTGAPGRQPAGRSGKRQRRPSRSRAVQTTFLQRNRIRLIGAAAAAVLVVLAGFAYLNVTSPVYACSSEFTPTPAPSTAASHAPGYVEPDMGRTHIDVGTHMKYAFCPPASGWHYNATGYGPIQPAVYGPDQQTVPQGWIHNLEHGALVLLYKCPGEACSDAGQAALKQLYDDWPVGPVCGTPPHTIGPVITRFDDMAYPYAALVWDVVLPLQTLDTAQILNFFNAEAEVTNPEKFCTTPTPTPGATESAGPTGSAGPAATPTSPPASGG
jgi:Protein of unknown function (DUF3105)